MTWNPGDNGGYHSFQPEQPQEPQLLSHKEGIGFRRLYAPIVTIYSTAFDMTFVFGQSILEFPSTQYIEDKMAISMPWSAVKALVTHLNDQIEQMDQRQEGDV